MTSESGSQSISAGRTDDIPSSWDELTVLTTFLDYARDTVHAKCAGLSDTDARRAPLPGSPLMTICGLVSHLRWVESSWIEDTLLGCAIDAPWTEDDPDREFRIAVQVQLAQLLAEYRAACARHCDLVASLPLDAPSRGDLGQWRTEPVTLRWILLHLIEETARHNGHPRPLVPHKELPRLCRRPRHHRTRRDTQRTRRKTLATTTARRLLTPIHGTP